MIHVHLKPELLSVRCVCVSVLANRAFKVIVSCLTVLWIGQASTGLVYLKTGSAVIKPPGVMMPFFILSLVS